MKVTKKIYKDFSIYCYENKFLDIGKKIIDENFNTIKILKNTKRNYLSVIQIENKNYVLKEPRNEFRIFQRQLMTFFKKGEALTTLININEIITEYGFKEYIKPFLAIVKRKKNLIVYSALLYEYSEGKENRDFLDDIVLKMTEIHKIGRYHGDFNPSNFLIEKNGFIRILDTQGKKKGISNYRIHYDMLTMKMDSYLSMKYPYPKTISYFLALIVKKIKRLKFVKWIKLQRKILRDKNQKI